MGTDVDDIDRRIVNALLADGRASVRDLAAETGVAATTVTKRLEHLETEVIQGYVPEIDYAALGYTMTAIFHLDVRGDRLASLVERLRESDRMIGVYEVTGSHDLVAIGKFRSTGEMNECITDLLTNPAIRAGNTSVVLDTVREYEALSLPTDDDTSAG
ncbi:MAG: AsnC family transcriptional regulator [Halorientalis sp.]